MGQGDSSREQTELDLLRQRVTDLEQQVAAQGAELHRLRSLIQNAPDGISIADLDGTITAANPALQHLSGYGDEIVGTSLSDIYDETSACLSNLVQHVATHGSWQGHLTCKRKDNQPYQGQLSAFPISDGQEKAIAIAGIVRDVTGRHQVEESLRKFRRAVEQSPTSIVITDTSGAIEYVNPRFTRLTGYTFDEAYGKNPRILKSNCTPPEIYADMWQTITAGEEWHGEFVNRKKDGELYWETASISPVLDTAGNITHFIAVKEDITARKQTELMLQQSREELEQRVAERTTRLQQINTVLEGEVAERTLMETSLRRERDFISTILDTAGLLVVVLDRAGRVLLFNHACAATSGYVNEEILGKPIWDILIPPEERAAVRAIFAALRDQVAVSNQYEGDWLTREGQRRRIAWSNTVLLGADSQIEHIVGTGLDITERTRAKEALQQAHSQLEQRVTERTRELRQSQTLLQGLLDNSPAAIFLKDAERRYLLVNQRFAESSGYLPEQMIGQTEDELFTPEAVANWVDVDQHILATGATVDMEVPALHGDEPHTYVMTKFPLRDAQGAITAIGGIATDITAHKRTEEAYRTLVEHSLQGLIIFQHGRIVFTNPAMAAINGYSIEEMLNWTQEDLARLIYPEDAPMVWGYLKQRLNGDNIPTRYEYRIVRKNGEIRWLEAYGVVIHYLGKPASQGIYIDITDRKRAEEALRASEARYRGVIESQFDLIVRVDAEGRFVFVNDAYCRTFGKSREELLGTTFMPLVHEEDRASTLEAMRNLDVPPYRAYIEQRAMTVYGWRWLAWEDYAIKDEHGTTTEIQGVGRDITDRKQATEELRKRTTELSLTNTELALAARAKDEFLANMSHELRTPLNAILGLSEALQEQVYGEMNDKQQHTLRTIEESGRHLLALINDILDLSKIESGNEHLHIGKMQVQDVCHASLRMIKQSAQKKRLVVSQSIAPDVVTLVADERRIKQILVNLLSNAVKFTPEGGKVGLEVRGDEQQHITFTVWDTGIGIAPEQLERLFKPFVQIDSGLSRQHEGTGLGLALVARLTEMHGGHVSVESTEGQGSRFMVSLPWRDQQTVSLTKPRTARSPDTPATAAAPDSDPGAPVILLVEDNATTSLMFSDYLLIKGYHVVTASNGREALERLQSLRPAMILMDIQMPDMDGLEAMRRIRAVADLADIPIIALTALVMPGDRERCLEAGASEYLSKPIDLKQLLRIINGYM